MIYSHVFIVVKIVFHVKINLPANSVTEDIFFQMNPHVYHAKTIVFPAMMISTVQNVMNTMNITFLTENVFPAIFQDPTS